MLGPFLQERRKESGRRVLEVVAHMGVSKATVYLWESALSRPDPVDIRRLLQFYGCSEEQIAEALRLRSLCLAVDPSAVSAPSETSEDSEPDTLADGSPARVAGAV
jgi:transcriptional regulator with XRE-family HTH domain